MSTLADSPIADGPVGGIDPHAPLPPGNTSATGGYLVAPVPDRVALRRFFQGLIRGVTGLPGDSVRRLWQPNPPPRPEIDVDWCAFAISERSGNTLGGMYVQTNRDDSTFIRYDQRLNLNCTFYGPNCEGYAELLREGLQIGQNREVLQVAGMGLGGLSSITHVPEKIQDQWYDRADISFMIDREVSKLYQILSFGSAVGVIITESMQMPFGVVQP